MFKTLATLALTLLPALGSASTITTEYAANSGARGNMFDIIVGAQDIIIDAFDLNMFQNGTIEFYIREGGYAGYESDASAWTLRSSSTVTSAGPNLASNFDVLNTRLQAGQTYGIFISDVDQPSILNSNATAEGAVAATNGDLTVTQGTANYGFLFHFGPRTWNGSVRYALAPVPVPAAGFLLVGALGSLVVARRRS